MSQTMTARIICPRCEPPGDLIDPNTPLLPLAPVLVADLARAHDEAEHGGPRTQTTYDAIVASVVLLQAQHG